MTTRIVIIGGGFGGLEAAFSLRGLLTREAEITLIDRSAYHAYIPSVHLLVSGKAAIDAIRIPLKVVLGPAGVRFVQDEALFVRAEKREVATSRESFPYDYLVLSAGAENNFFDIPGIREHSCYFRTPDDAACIRTRLTQLLAEHAACRLALAGAGTEGVEVAGEVLDLISAEGRDDDLKTGSISVELIEEKAGLLPGFPRAAGECAERYLRRRGATVVAGDRIARVEEGAIVLASGTRRKASLLIWSGGVQPSKTIRDLPLPKAPGGWLLVTDFLRSPGDERVYGIGDAVSIRGQDGPLSLQRLASHAQDQARVAALNIAADIGGRDLARYVPKIRPQLISLGRSMGIFTLNDTVRSGPWVVDLKKAVERKHLMACLTRPVTSAVWSLLPGAAFAQRLRMKLRL